MAALGDSSTSSGESGARPVSGPLLFLRVRLWCFQTMRGQHQFSFLFLLAAFALGVLACLGVQRLFPAAQASPAPALLAAAQPLAPTPAPALMHAAAAAAPEVSGTLGALVSSMLADIDGLSRLYKKYREELLEVRKLALAFCSTPKPAGFPHTHKCLSTLEEMELLYLGIRERPPAHMLEVASASGYTTLWIIHALHKNGGGLLHSFDLFQTPWPDVLDPKLRDKHWRFTLGDVLQTYPAYASSTGLVFDRILIDAEHTASFGYFYIDQIIQPQLRALQARANNESSVAVMELTVHDIYYFAEKQGVTGEGEVVLKWLGYMVPLSHIQCLPTFNLVHRLDRHNELRAVQISVLGAEAEAKAPLIGQFPHGDLSLRCIFWTHPQKPA